MYPARRTLTTPTKILLASLELRRDQADLVDSGTAHDVDGVGDVGKQYIVIAFNESYFLRAILENLLNARAESCPTRIFVVDLDLAVLQHLHAHGFVFRARVRLLFGFR